MPIAATSPIFPTFSHPAARVFGASKPSCCATTWLISTPAASSRRVPRAGCRRCGIYFDSCSANGFAATIRRQSCPARSAGAACRRCLSIADVDRLLVRARVLIDAPENLTPAAASRDAALLPARGALRHGLRVSGTGGAAALGLAPRRADDRGTRQGRQGKAGAAERGFATGDGRLSRRHRGAQAGCQKKRGKLEMAVSLVRRKRTSDAAAFRAAT